MSAQKILVIEDNRVDLSVVTARLRREGYQVMGAMDGTDAIQAARDFQPDLILLDLTLIARDPFNSPTWEGFSLLEWMRRIVPGMDIPVVVYTARAYSAIATQAAACGVSCVFEKGGDLAVLMSSIREILAASQLGRAAGL